ncbi:hypothetical protein JW835_14705 [bacterium]|nr:hypothetical protein [bacterium]
MRNEKKEIIIFDYKVEGHHTYYNSLLFDKIISSGYRVTFLTSMDIINYHSYKVWVKYKNDLNIIFINKSTFKRYPFVYFLKAWNIINKNHPNHLIIPMLDGLFMNILLIFIINGGKCFNIKWTTLYFRPIMHYSNADIKSDYYYKRATKIKLFFKKLVFRIIISDNNLNTVFMLDEFATGYFNSYFNTNKFKHLPDPVPDIYYNNNDKKLDDGQGGHKIPFKIIAYGWHTVRKGTNLLLNSIIDILQENKDFKLQLLIVGPIMDSNILNTLRSKRAKQVQENSGLILVNKFITHAESLKYLLSSDCICLPYINHIGSVSILIQGLVLKKLIIASDQNWLGHYIKSHSAGYTFEHNNINSLRKTIMTVYGLKRKNQYLSIKNNFDMEYYREKNFKNIFTGNIL